MRYNFTEINRNLAKEDDRVYKKSLRFEARDDIEEIIKAENINRTHFHEFNKYNFKEIIRKFFFTFSDIKNHTASVISLSSMHCRSDLKSDFIDCFFRTYDWCEYMKTIKNAVPDKQRKLFLILEEGWVYEGKLDEMFIILNEMTCNTTFYIVSSKFDWFIAVSDMEDYACLYKL